jgi:hypothetical protein
MKEMDELLNRAPGIPPEMLLLCRLTHLRYLLVPKFFGMFPVSWLLGRKSEARFGSKPICSGMLPWRLLLLRVIL